MKEYGFKEKMDLSNKDLEEKDLAKKILSKIFYKEIEVTKASKEYDLKGIDYWVKFPNGKIIGIDFKIRGIDFYAKKGKNDLALETWSQIYGEKENWKIGWTRDSKKQTDFVLWYWKDTERFCLISFILLCKVFQKNWEKWREKYEHSIQSSEDWQSECVFVPKKVLFDELIKTFCGDLNSNLGDFI